MRTACVKIEPGPDGVGFGVSLTSDDPGPLPRSSAYVMEVRGVPSDVDDDALLRRVSAAHDPEYRTRKYSYHFDDLRPHAAEDKDPTAMPVGQPLFLGFKSIRELVARRPLRDQVFYFPIVESEMDGQGMGMAMHRLIVTALLDGGIIGYVAFDLAKEQILGGQRWGPGGEPSNPQSRITSISRLTRNHLAGLGMEPIEAILARPRSYTFLVVVPDFVDYDKATDSFIPRKPTPDPYEEEVNRATQAYEEKQAESS